MKHAVFTGKKFLVSGMTLEVITGNETHWLARNLTTGESVQLEKAAFEKSIRLGMAEEIPGNKQY